MVSVIKLNGIILLKHSHSQYRTHYSVEVFSIYLLLNTIGCSWGLLVSFCLIILSVLSVPSIFNTQSHTKAYCNKTQNSHDDTDCNGYQISWTVWNTKINWIENYSICLLAVISYLPLHSKIWFMGRPESYWG